jgi:anti-sigma-K factor RskA
MTDHEQWDELAAGYALHGLAPAEDAQFIEHLATCPECSASLKEHEFVAAQLGSISHYRDDDEAPTWESMRDRIIGAPTQADDDTEEVVDLSARRRRYNVSRRVLAAAAAVVIVAGGGIVALELTTGGSGCSASSGCHQIQLDAAGGRTLASLVVRHDTITVTPTNMPTAPTGKVYVLWQQPRNGQATPIGEFTTGTGGSATAALSEPYGVTSAFAVSLEPATSTPPSTPSNTLASGTAT